MSSSGRLKGCEAGPLYRRDMNEDITAARFRANETIALSLIEEFKGTSCHDIFLSIDQKVKDFGEGYAEVGVIDIV
ncbi:hypothetical protein Aam_022_007 [Acidocella aminolytica 101 = DSM 11237]|uniref:Uncharacterized protein n=2 Tax=Acidocella TaxID=50709 RepID=A0A0D6PCM5_9PROT|nr:hypothetical protein Aam_022_007 [Acidocella aminolytica 101 = DSM 11237]GBQ32633.1 hypothetical protein AA11237_0203 [Acidocella aminolytica 101 = DSM 11237]